MIEETIIKYQPLGRKTLFMLIFKKSVVLVMLFPLLPFGIYILNRVSAEYFNLAVNLFFGYFVFCLLVLFVIFATGYLQYFRYGIFIDDKSLKIQRGLISVEELGIPYRRIKDVRIERTLIDQIFEVSDIIVTVLDADTIQEAEESIIILPSIEREIALKIQDSILKKAQVEQINVLAGHRIV